LTSNSATNLLPSRSSVTPPFGSFCENSQLPNEVSVTAFDARSDCPSMPFATISMSRKPWSPAYCQPRPAALPELIGAGSTVKPSKSSSDVTAVAGSAVAATNRPASTAFQARFILFLPVPTSDFGHESVSVVEPHLSLPSLLRRWGRSSPHRVNRGLDAAPTADEPNQPGSDRRGEGCSLHRARPTLSAVPGEPFPECLLDPLSGLLPADHPAVVIGVPRSPRTGATEP